MNFKVYAFLISFLISIASLFSCTGSGGGSPDGIAKSEIIEINSSVSETLGQTVNSSQVQETLASGNVQQNIEEIGKGDGAQTTFSKILSASPVVQGSVKVLVEGTNITGQDDGSGNLDGTGLSGSIDYSSGVIVVNLTDPAPMDASVVTSYKSSFSNSGSKVLQNKPQPGTLEISDGTQTLEDDGMGELTGEGSGTVDYSSGFVTWNFNSFPSGDVIAIYEASDLKSFTYMLSSTPVIPNTLQITIGNLSLEDDGSGNLTGDGSGTISYESGFLKFSVNESLSDGLDIVAFYQKDVREFSYTVSSPPVEEGTVLIQSGNLVLADDGEGKLDGDGSGTVDYETGVINFTFSSVPAEDIEVLYTSLEKGGD
ncbi:MAG TPA: hypothetical protein VNN20_06130 [Thermodesulfobacteriota bacterium]|nr:hypothetical protein [Thermodesulfobacteriota bacterium]